MFAICEKIIQNNRFKPNRRLFSSYTFTCFDDVAMVPELEWNEAIKDYNLFLSYRYLNLIHHQKTVSFRFRYVIIYNRKKPIGVMYFQINDFSATLFSDLISSQISELNPVQSSALERYLKLSENDTIMRLITCGNNFISGENGFYLDVNNKETTFKIVEGVIDCVAREEKLRGKISTILVKDFYEEGFGDKDCWYCTKFIHFNVEPNMVITLAPTIHSITDYLASYSKKYRNRAKHILQASATLTLKRLTTTEIIIQNDTLYALYLQVYNQATFKFEQLTKNYFSEVAQQFPSHFYVDAWYKNSELVSFASGFYLPSEIEAHYIGLNYKLNKEFELYQTILYSYIEEAINQKKLTINLGRTACEIKTTVGAKAHDLICYIKPQNTVSKLILKPFMKFLQPSEWVPRNPFKELE